MPHFILLSIGLDLNDLVNLNYILKKKKNTLYLK